MLVSWPLRGVQKNRHKTLLIFATGRHCPWCVFVCVCMYVYIYDWGAFPTHGDFLLSLFDLPFRAADWSRYEITKASGGGRRSDEKDEAMMRRRDEND